MLDRAAPVNLSSGEPRQFRKLRAGPEADLQLAVQQNLNALFPPTGKPIWTGGSVPVGAGFPDIVRTEFEPELVTLADIDVTSLSMMAYLRAVGKARADTIGSKLGKGTKAVQNRLSMLEDVDIAVASGNTYSLSEKWRQVLSDVLAIEVKVTDWRKALSQAARNRIFSNRSYVALPINVAKRVSREPLFGELGVGLIAVQDDEVVKIMRRARKTNPKVWSYYYSIASLAADEVSGINIAVPN